ncbi:MAG: hypothetical protein VCD50_10340 [Alphaproteobacteria bacterium]|jgi:hypothetical protein
MSTPTDDYVLRFTSGSDALIAKDEAMALARSRNMSLRDFILSALVHERERISQTPLADDGPLSDKQIDWLRAQFPDNAFDGETQIGPALW